MQVCQGLLSHRKRLIFIAYLPAQQWNWFQDRPELLYTVRYGSPVRPPFVTSYLGGVEPQFGYYLGGFLYKDLTPNRLTFRLDATIQMKSARAANNGKTVFNASYYYLGITPLIGLRLTDRLTIYTGPEGSLQVAKGKSWGKGYPFELGVHARLTYDFGRFGAELGYFRGFTRIDRFEIGGIPGGPGTNDIYNQHVQAGLIYRLGQ